MEQKKRGKGKISEMTGMKGKIVAAQKEKKLKREKVHNKIINLGKQK